MATSLAKFSSTLAIVTVEDTNIASLVLNHMQSTPCLKCRHINSVHQIMSAEALVPMVGRAQKWFKARRLPDYREKSADPCRRGHAFSTYLTIKTSPTAKQYIFTGKMHRDTQLCVSFPFNAKQALSLTLSSAVLQKILHNCFIRGHQCSSSQSVLKDSNL